MSELKKDVNERALEQIARGIAIFDLDGTMFDDSVRRPHLTPNGGEDALRAYYKGVTDDPLNSDVFDIAKLCIESNFRMVFMTGRPVHYWDKTIWQLKKAFGNEFESGKDFELVMRPAHNKMTSPVLKRDMTKRLLAGCPPGSKIILAIDDRWDVCDMFKEFTQSLMVSEDGKFTQDKEDIAQLIKNHASLANMEMKATAQGRTAADILTLGGETFRERNSNYRDNAVQVGQVMQVLFPNGVTLKTQADHHFYHLFELMVVKLTRFANSDLKHVDSIHDLMVYAAMCENVIEPHSIKVH